MVKVEEILRSSNQRGAGQRAERQKMDQKFARDENPALELAQVKN